ncbi:MAG: hypothetical protein H0X33_14210 [Taibaiella sp.]|nr:hypothetical protein [Taibaiella sp.]
MDTIEIQLFPPDITQLGITLTEPGDKIWEITLNKLGGQGVPGNGSANDIKNEIPTGAINGSNATFFSLYNFIPESVEVFLNGLKLKNITEYNTAGNTQITLNVSPTSTEYLIINYTKL